MSKLDWIKQQIDEVEGMYEDDFEGVFLGELREQFLNLVANEGESLTRSRFDEILDELTPSEDHPNYYEFDFVQAHFRHEANLSELWEGARAPILPEILGKMSYGDVPMPEGFVKLGGAPDWIQEGTNPFCEQCDVAMSLLLQISSLPYELTKHDKSLRAYCFGDAGNFYLFRCPRCEAVKTDVDCY